MPNAITKDVALIEEQAGPRGAVVRSPDRLPDLTTGRLREVAASIRFRAGTVDLLLTIECRKRSRKGDVTWIEQLATKRQRLGVARTIAVSEVGFSAEATTIATQHGIDVRQLSTISPDDIADWFLPGGVVHLFRLVENFSAGSRFSACPRRFQLIPTLPYSGTRCSMGRCPLWSFSRSWR